MNIKQGIVGALIAAVIGNAPLTAEARSLSGAYLAARQASIEADFRAASHYFKKSLVLDRKNSEIEENLLFSELALGAFSDALPRANKMVKNDQDSRIARLAELAYVASTKDHVLMAKALSQDTGLGGLVDGLARAWFAIFTEQPANGLAQFDALLGAPATEGAVLYHKALALAYAGACGQAEKILATLVREGWRLPERGIWSRIQCLSQQEAASEALKLVGTLAADPASDKHVKVIAKLTNGRSLSFSEIKNYNEALAEVYFSIAGLLPKATAADFALIYARLASYLRPEFTQAKLLSAELLEELRQYELAIETYGEVSSADPEYYRSVLGQADVLLQSERDEKAVDLLERLVQSHGHLSDVEIAYADALRRQERYDDATGAYDRALALINENDPNNWFIYYARGIANERAKLWPAAELDFRKALELFPDQPQVLNYLGYSLVEKKIKLDEALELIQKAVELSPNSGYIVDSLGWILFRLGRHDEAVPHMERAAELMPVDPIVNDHLGDVYWAVGRVTEAQFQWRRALSFDPEEAEAERIRKKLDQGLDAVWIEEGTEPSWTDNSDA